MLSDGVPDEHCVEGGNLVDSHPKSQILKHYTALEKGDLTTCNHQGVIPVFLSNSS